MVIIVQCSIQYYMMTTITCIKSYLLKAIAIIPGQSSVINIIAQHLCDPKSVTVTGLSTLIDTSCCVVPIHSNLIKQSVASILLVSPPHQRCQF
jgi:hypothetical protein